MGAWVLGNTYTSAGPRNAYQSGVPTRESPFSVDTEPKVLILHPTGAHARNPRYVSTKHLLLFFRPATPLELLSDKPHQGPSCALWYRTMPSPSAIAYPQSHVIQSYTQETPWTHSYPNSEPSSPTPTPHPQRLYPTP